MLKTSLKSAHGFSMVQALVLGSILAGAGFLTSHFIKSQKLSQKGVESKEDTLVAGDIVYSILQNQDHCRSTFIMNKIVENGYDIKPLLGKTYPLKEGVYTESVPGKPILTIKVGAQYSGGKITISKFTVTMPVETHELGRLQINFLRTGPGYVGEGLVRTIPFIVQTRPGSPAFSTCYAVKEGGLGNRSLVQDFCERVGESGSFFVWDEKSQTCRPKNNNCPLPQSLFTGIGMDGEAICRPIEDWMDFSKIIDSTPTNCSPGINVRLEPTLANKVRIACNNAPCEAQRLIFNGCEATAPEAIHGRTVSLSDYAKPMSGSADFQCVDGSWLLKKSNCSP